MKPSTRHQLIILSAFLLFGMSCGKSGDSSVSDSQNTSSTGQGGSLSRFAISQDHLYVLANNSVLSFNIQNAAIPYQTDSTGITYDWSVETIFGSDSNLFFGSNNGLFIFSLTNPSIPQYVSLYSHIKSCDPVVSEGKIAYVTLRTGTNCPRGLNALEVIDISDLRQPRLIKSHPMSHPIGLGLKNGYLIVCDNGLKAIDTTGIASTIHISQSMNKIKATDIIPQYNSNNIIVTGEDGIFQYSFIGGTFNLLSKVYIQ